MKNNYLKTTIGNAVFAFAVASATAQIPTNGLVAHYPLDGNGLDVSGNDYHATTVTATPTTDRFGNPGSAMNFVAAQQQYLEVPYNAPFTTDSKTVMAWFRSDAGTGAYHRIVTMPHPNGYSHYQLYMQSGYVVTGASYSAAGWSTITTAPTLVNDNQWHHVTSVIEYLGYYDNAYNYNVKIYLDGQWANTAIHAGSQFMTTTDYLQIGRFNSTWGEYFQGDIDDILFYDRALSDSEINHVFAPCVAQITPNPQSICIGESYSINSHVYMDEGTYLDTLQTTNGCDSIIETALTVHDLPEIVASADDHSICIGSTTNVSATGAGSIQWDNALGAGSSHAVTPGQTTIYTAIGLDGNGCEASDTVIVSVSDNPIVEVSASSEVICLGQSSLLTATGSSVVDWAWSEGLGFDATLSVSPTEETTYGITGTDANGCEGYEEITIEVELCVSVLEAEGIEEWLIAQDPRFETATVSNIPSGTFIRIWDVAGKLMLQIASNASQIVIDTQRFENGIYVIELNYQTNRTATKLVIAR